VSAAIDAPRPPFLVLRPGIAFWVQDKPVEAAAATPQALAEGCYDGAACYDSTGGAWDILAAAYREPQPARWRQWLLRWQRHPVALRLGPRREVAPRDLLRALEDVLESGGAFAESLDQPAATLHARLRGARDSAELIALAATID